MIGVCVGGRGGGLEEEEGRKSYLSLSHYSHSHTAFMNESFMTRTVWWLVQTGHMAFTHEESKRKSEGEKC